MTIPEFQSFIFSWWEKNQRDLPWRKTRDPYSILVSEIMLQQTQVLRVIPKYAEFMKAFPSVRDLASVPLSSVLIHWKGLGYNRRAKYLWETAQRVIQEYDGVYPKSEASLLSLPGLGKYTARAILVFAYNEQLSFVDTNINKIITHYFYNGNTVKPKIVWDFAEKLLPYGKAWEWHQALMDYGACALPLLASAAKKPTGSSIPFRQSRRFYRGRIIDALRNGKMKKTELIVHITQQFGIGIWNMEEIISTLIKEGLLQEDNFHFVFLSGRRE